MTDIGFKNYIDESRILTIIGNNTSRAKWLVREALSSGRLINCTQGKKAGCVIILNTGHIVLSSLKISAVKIRIQSVDKAGSINKNGYRIKNSRKIINDDEISN